MSVDKFGRHVNSVKQSGLAAKGPPGEGFKLTSEGNYDIDNKLLCNVSDPFASKDAVNLQTLNEQLQPCLKFNSLKRKYDTAGLTIGNVADPIDDSDVVTKTYMQSKIPIKIDEESYSFGQSTIHDVGYPKNPGDAVNVNYVKDNCLMYGSGKIDAKNNAITNVKDASNGGDAINKKYFDQRTPGLSKYQWKFFNRRLSGVLEPVEGGDVVTLNYIRKNTLTSTTVGWNVANKRLRLTADPKELTDAINLNYLVRILGETFYGIYNQLSPEKIPQENKSEWIRRNIVEPYFIDPQTKVLRTHK